MPLYDNLPGIELEIKDGNLILPAEPSPTQTVLIIAPTSAAGTAGPYLAAEYNPVLITSQSEFATKGMGVFDKDNPMARLWKQAYDAGCRDIRVIQLKGTTAVQRYGFLHDIFYVLEENITADIIVIGGIYADDTVSAAGIAFVFDRADYAETSILATSKYTSVPAETVGTGDGTEVEFTLAHSPVISDIALTSHTGTAAAVFNTGAFTAIGDLDAGKTVIFKGVTATLKTAADAVPASASSATAGEATIVNGATAAQTAAGFKAIFDAIIAAYPASAVAPFTFTAPSTSLILTGTIADGAANNAEVITGTATFASTTNQTQLTTPGVTTAATIAVADYTVALLTGVVTFDADKAPALGVVIKAAYKYYTPDFASELAGFCEVVSAKNRQIIGVMSLKPPIDNNLATVKTYVDGQVTQYFSRYLQIVGGAPMWFNIGSALYEDMWHGAYAGFISLLPAYSSPMFKAIPGALFGSYKLSPTQITALINKHIVVPRERNGRIIIADAITTSADTSDFVRLTTLRVVNDVVQLVREIAEPYIGESNTVARRNALDTAIREGLKNMVVRGALNDFRFHITSTIADQIDGTMRIMLDIVPVFETRRILMAVAVKPML